MASSTMNEGPKKVKTGRPASNHCSWSAHAASAPQRSIAVGRATSKALMPGFWTMASAIFAVGFTAEQMNCPDGKREELLSPCKSNFINKQLQWSAHALRGKSDSIFAAIPKNVTSAEVAPSMRSILATSFTAKQASYSLAVGTFTAVLPLFKMSMASLMLDLKYSTHTAEGISWKMLPPRRNESAKRRTP